MALPSSAVIPLNVGVQSPQIDLAALSGAVTNPALTPQQAGDILRNAYGTAQQIGTDLVLRPKQLATAGAQLDDARTLADMNVALRPAQQNAGQQTFNAQAETGATAAEQQSEVRRDLTDPAWRVRAATAQIVALQDDLDKAQADVVEAHATGDEKAIETANKKAGKIAGEKLVYENRLKILTADQTAAERASAAKAAAATAGATLAEGDAVRANTNVQAADTAAELARTQQGILLQAAQRSATPTIQSAVDAARAQAGAAAAAAAPFANPVVAGAVNEGAQAAAITTALSQKANLAYLASQLASGNYSGGVSPEQDKSIRDAAAAVGVPVFLPNGGKRPISEVSADYAKQVNVKDAEKQVGEIRDVAAASQNSLAALQQIKNLGKVNTGTLYTMPGVQKLDRVFAQFGVEQSQKRELYSALNQRLTPLVRQPGSVSNFEQELYQKALPGPGLSDATNVAMFRGLLSVGERNAARPAFYDALLGPLPIGEVNKIWNGYVDSNPTILDSETANANALTPGQYVKILTADPQTADATVRSLAGAIDVSKLPLGNSAADLANAPATAPFLASAGARGALIAVPNPKYWAPIVEEASKIRTATSVASPAATQQTKAFQGALNAPIESFIRPVAPVIPLSGPPPDLVIRKK